MSRFCFVGLGNPGAKYKGTRHNIGFEWVEALSSLPVFSSQKIKASERFQSYWASARYEEHEIHFLLPQTFMNESGRAVSEWKQKYQSESSVVVIYDDMDVVVGKMRYREKGSDGGHRGMRSIIECLGTQEIPRLRIGIGRPADESIDHVLTRFAPSERVVMNRLLGDIESHLKILVSATGEKIMNQLNSKDYSEANHGA